MASLPNGLTAIGVVRSARRDPSHTPVQSSLNRDEVARVEVDRAYVDGLDGLTGFDYAWLLTWLDRVEPSSRAELRQVPFLLRSQARQVGIFATRGPRRVNPIGLSLVRLLAVSGTSIEFSGVDLLDGTAVIDVKPYVTAFDRPPVEPRCGWFEHIALPLGATPASLAAAPPAQE
jgi:tRNA (adenine37-N6)-methyltransferase